jgi:alcohol dehydrogenase (cytochrome c)
VVGGGGSGGARRKNIPHPASPDGLGEFLAMHARTGKVLWRHRTRMPPNTSALTTAGGLVIVGDLDRYFTAHDAVSGKILFQTRLTTSPQGFPITYAVKGRQYIAVPVGTGGGQWVTTIPGELVPGYRSPPLGNAMFVFALPESRAPRTSTSSEKQ